MAKRKSKAERDQQWAGAERRVWESFHPKLSDLKSFEEAVQLVAQTPQPDSPGRRYYSNLGFFLQSFWAPMGANYAELELYSQFVKRLDDAGKLKPEARRKIEEDLNRAMEERGPW